MKEKNWDIDMSGLNDNMRYFIRSMYGDITKYPIRK